MFNATLAAKISLASSTMTAMLIGFLGNSVIVFLFIFNKGLQNGTNLHLLNLSICYMTTSVLHMPACLISIASGPGRFSSFFCNVLQFSHDLIYTQISLATLSFVLYQYTIVRAFKRTPADPPENFPKIVFCCLSWVLSTIASCISRTVNDDCSSIFAKYSNFIVSWFVFIGLFVICSFVTLTFLVFTYIHISRVRKTIRDQLENEDKRTVSMNLTQFNQNVTTSLVVFVLSFFCSTPLTFYRVFSGRHIMENRYFYTLCLVQLYFVQSAVFPVLTAYRSRSIRAGFRQLFCAVISHQQNNSLIEDLYEPSPRLTFPPAVKKSNSTEKPAEPQPDVMNKKLRNVANYTEGGSEENMKDYSAKQQNGHCVKFQENTNQKHPGKLDSITPGRPSSVGIDRQQQRSSNCFDDEMAIEMSMTADDVKMLQHRSATGSSRHPSPPSEVMTITDDIDNNYEFCVEKESSYDSISKTLLDMDSKETYI